MIPAVDKLGGWPAAWAVLASNGIPKSKQKKYAWSNRGLPRDVVTILSAEMHRQGIEFEASDFNPKESA